MEMGLEDKAFWKDYKELEKKKSQKENLVQWVNILQITFWVLDFG